MKKICLYLLTFLSCEMINAQEYAYNYSIFSNSMMSGNFFYSAVKQSGASFIKNVDDKIPVSENIFHTPGNALQLSYKDANDGNWQAQIFYHDTRGMEHFKRPKYFSFWIYSDKENVAQNDLPIVKLIKSDSSLSSQILIPDLKAGAWQRVLIPMMSVGKIYNGKRGNVLGVVFSQQSKDDKAHEIFVDDIEFTDTSDAAAITTLPLISTAKGCAMHVDITWNKISDKNIRFVKVYRSEDGKYFKAVGIEPAYINRYADFTGQTDKKFFYKISFMNDAYKETNLSEAMNASTRRMTDDELLSMVQEAAFHYYWDGAESHSGLALENISGKENMIAAGASGFGVMALIVGTERKFITHEEAVDRFIKIVNFLDNAEKFHGAFPHFINGETGKVEPFFGRQDDGADLVETSFLMQGLLTARQYFSENNEKEKHIRETITKLWNNVEWSWFKITDDSKFLYWHWSPDKAWIIHHNLIGWNETMITYLLAIASPTHGVDASMYYSGWANQDSTGIKYRSAWGGTFDGSHYTNGNTYYGIKLDVGVSNGGPLFFTHYSYMGFDPHAITDKYTNYFTNNKNIALINYNYCAANPNHYKGYGDSCWGLTASLGAYDYFPNEPVKERDNGKMTPTGAISSFPYTPQQSMNALKNYYFNYGKFLWGEYGFRDAFDLTNNWCSDIYMGLNQAPMVVMIENYRTGLIWKLFMSNEEVQNELKKLSFTNP